MNQNTNNIDSYIVSSIKAFFTFAICALFIAMIFLFCRDALASSQDWLDQCAPYKKQVTEILIDNGVSEGFYYLMVAESHCREEAVSVKGARGFWQLMPSTSRHYGCNNPDDLECATRAAAKYLAHLSVSFKTFDEIIAAYNMGGHNFRQKGHTQQSIGLIRRVHELRRLDSD